MPIHKLTKTATRRVERAIEELFERIKARLLGPAMVGKGIVVSYQHDLSLPGLFEAAAREEGTVHSQDTLDALMRIANNYLDAAKLRMKARVVNQINASLRDASLENRAVDFKTILGGKLSDVWKDTTNHIHSIVDSEAQQVRNMGSMEGLLKVAGAHGISDPTVYFVVVRDKDLCDECRRLHLMPNGKTPRVYRLSELGHGYHKKGEDDPKLGGLHPHCRCSLVLLMPGFGFDKGGMVKWIARDHDEYAKQH